MESLKKAYTREVQKKLKQTSAPVKDILTEEDIKHLPEIVQKYLKYANVIGKEKVRNFKVIFDGEFKINPEKGWASMNAEQYSDLTDITRLYFLKMKMFGLPVTGFHKYAHAKATMLVKLAGLITVADGKGKEMNQGETVTVFNDMCLLAPASLIDKRIEWESIEPLIVKATLNNNECRISAILHFNNEGKLINFISDDRYYSPTGKTYQKIRWSTPVKDYKEYNGTRIASYGEAVWSFPEREYCYARAEIKEIEYNVEEYEK